MTEPAAEIPWESELAELLAQLTDAQEQLLALLATKRDLLTKQDHRGLTELAPREEALGAQLQACNRRRQELLHAASKQGLSSSSLMDLHASLSPRPDDGLQASLAAARERSRLIRHECLTQWVVVQRTVLHLSQILEIIATGGQSQPTYGTGEPPRSSGSLMDQAV